MLMHDDLPAFKQFQLLDLIMMENHVAKKFLLLGKINTKTRIRNVNGKVTMDSKMTNNI
jgi:hypothetical protein